MSGSRDPVKEVLLSLLPVDGSSVGNTLESCDPDRMRAALAEPKPLQFPYLNWDGKSERTSFEVEAVSLHVHEQIDSASILSPVRKGMKGEAKTKGLNRAMQPGMFDAPSKTYRGGTPSFSFLMKVVEKLKSVII